MKTKSYLILFILLAVTAGFVFADANLSRSVRAVDLNKLPLTLGGWEGESFPVQERILRILETEYILDRDYVNKEGTHVFLSIVYYPDNKIGFHNPESCNTGLGSKIVSKDIHPIKHGKMSGQSEEFKVNRLILERIKGDKVILYFFVSGNYMTEDYLRFRLHMMKQQMGFRRPSGAQIQIHSAVNRDLKATIGAMEDFIQNLTPLLSDYLN